MPDQPSQPQRQFSNTPEGQAAARELDAWVRQYRKEEALIAERDMLLERISSIQAEHAAILADLREQAQGVPAVTLVTVATELMREVTALLRQQREMDVQLREL